MSYIRRFYKEEITGGDAADYMAGYLQAHGGQYRCDITRKHQRNNLGIEWEERVYTFSFMLYPHEYENMMAEL